MESSLIKIRYSYRPEPTPTYCIVTAIYSSYRIHMEPYRHRKFPEFVLYIESSPKANPFGCRKFSLLKVRRKSIPSEGTKFSLLKVHQRAIPSGGTKSSLLKENTKNERAHQTLQNHQSEQLQEHRIRRHHPGNNATIRVTKANSSRTSEFVSKSPRLHPGNDPGPAITGSKVVTSSTAQFSTAQLISNSRVQ